EIYRKRFHQIWHGWLKISYKGINYGNLIANELANLCHYDTIGSNLIPISCKNLLFRLVYTFYKSPYIISFRHDHPKVLFLNEEDGRKDYQKQCDFVL